MHANLGLRSARRARTHELTCSRWKHVSYLSHHDEDRQIGIRCKEKVPGSGYTVGAIIGGVSWLCDSGETGEEFSGEEGDAERGVCGQRRVALEKYLRKLGSHPVIGKSEELRLFLEAQGKLQLVRSTDVASRMLDGAVRLPRQLFGSESVAVDLNDVAQPAKSGRDLLRIFKELKQSVTNDWSAAKPLVVEEDKEFMEKKDKLMEFEQQLSNVSQQAESLVKYQQDMGETMGELGLAFVKLTKFETEEAEFESQRVRAADMKNVATAAVKASRLYRELNTQTIKHLDKLHEYLGTMLAINNAFSDRSSALLTVQTLSSELASLHSRIEKLEVASSRIFGGDKSRMRKIEELKEAAKVTENAKICADREYERIKENNRSELERIDQERQSDFQSMLRGFVVNQAGYAEKMAAVWEKLAEETATYSRDSS